MEIMEQLSQCKEFEVVGIIGRIIPTTPKPKQIKPNIIQIILIMEYQ